MFPNFTKWSFSFQRWGSSFRSLKNLFVDTVGMAPSPSRSFISRSCCFSNFCTDIAIFGSIHLLHWEFFCIFSLGMGGDALVVISRDSSSPEEMTRESHHLWGLLSITWDCGHVHHDTQKQLVFPAWSRVSVFFFGHGHARPRRKTVFFFGRRSLCCCHTTTCNRSGCGGRRIFCFVPIARGGRGHPCVVDLVA